MRCNRRPGPTPYNGMNVHGHGGLPVPPTPRWGIIDYNDLSKVAVGVDLPYFALADYLLVGLSPAE